MVSSMKKMQKFWEFGAGRTCAAALCAHSVSVSIGICQGYSAILIPQLTDSRDFHITGDQGSWLASLGAVTNPIGSILSGVLAEYFGRKRSIQLSSIPFVAGWLCIAFGKSLPWLYAGRLITGIAAGMSSACYTYVSEISTAENRGILQALGPICASFGILLTYILGYLLDWLYVARVSLLFALLTIVAVQPFPESPPYLLKTGRKEECFNTYFWFRRSTAVAQEEVDKHHQESNADNKTTVKDYLSAATIKPFLILITLFFLQEVSGIYSILYYTVNFFEETGVNIDDYLSSILVGVIRFVMAIFAAFLINKFGRRTLCILSSTGMSASMFVLCAYFKYYELHPHQKRFSPTFPLYFVIFNVLFSMVGMLPIPWVLVGEMFPLKVRSIMAGIVICMAQCFIFICVKIYPDLINLLNFSGTLFTFLVASVLTVGFCKWFLPETKGKSLCDIEHYFQQSQQLATFNNNVLKGQIEKGFDNKGFDISTEYTSKADIKIFTIKDIER